MTQSYYCPLTDKKCREDFQRSINDNIRTSEVFLISDSQINGDYWESVKDLIKKYGLTPVEAVESVEPGFLFCKRICSRIKRSLFTVADISFWRKSHDRLRPNIFLEIGLSIANMKPTLILTYEKVDEALKSFSDLHGVFICKLQGKKPPSANKKKVTAKYTLRDKDKKAIARMISTCCDLAFATYLINFLSNCEEIGDLRRPQDIQDYDELMDFCRRITLFNLDVKVMYQGVCERFFDDEFVSKVISISNSYGSEDNRKNIIAFSKNFRDLLIHSNCVEVMSKQAISSFCRSTDFMGVPLDPRLKKAVILTLLDFIGSRAYKYKLYLTEKDQLLVAGKGTLMLGNNFLLSIANERPPSLSELPPVIGEFKYGEQQAFLTRFNEISRAKTTIKDQHKVKTIIREICRSLY